MTATVDLWYLPRMKRARVTFQQVDLSVIENHHRLVWMDAQCFPADAPAIVPGAAWWLGTTHDGQAVAYCAWKARLEGALPVGYLYRTGVLPSHRGLGLQGRMITLRCRDMRRQGIRTAVSCTTVTNAASSRSLMAAGFKPYNPVPGRSLITDDMIHWRKDL